MSDESPTAAPQSERPAGSSPGNGRKRFPTDFQRKTLWSAITALSLVAVGWVVVFSLKIIAQTLNFLQPVLVPLAFAGILAYLLEPLIKKLTNRGTPRYRAMVMIFAAFHLVMIFIFLSVVVPTIGQVSNWIKKWPENKEAVLNTLEKQVLIPLEQMFPLDYQDEKKKEERKRLREEREKLESDPKGDGKPAETELAAEAIPVSDPIDEGVPGAPGSRSKRFIQEHSDMLAQKGWDFVNLGFRGLMGLFGYLVGFILVPVYLYYFLKESSKIKENWSNILPLRQSEFKTELVSVVSEINGYLIAFFRGQMLVSLIDGLLVGIALFILGLPYASIIGMCVALFGLLPYVGHTLCWIAALAISIIHFSVPENMWPGMQQWWHYPLIVTIIFLVVMKLDGLVFGPKIIGDAVGLHPLTVIFSVLFWSLVLGGILGALLAVPLSAAVKVVFRRYVWDMGLQGKLNKTYKVA